MEGDKSEEGSKRRFSASAYAGYWRVIGVLLLTFVLIMLLSTPSMIFAKSITTIGAELSQSGAGDTFVRAKLDFGSNEHMQAFPRKIGNWRGSDYSKVAARLARVLHADVMLIRAYSNPKFYQPIFFLIVQSNNRSSFHPPIVCYPALGYEIEEVGKVEIPIRNASWVEEPLFTEPLNRTRIAEYKAITAKKLIVAKESPRGEITERRVVLYFYVNEKPVSQKVTMVRVSALAPIHGSCNDTLNMTAEFMSETIPYMFELKEEGPPIIYTLASSGMGKVAVVLILLFPALIIFYPEIHTLILNLKLRNRQVPP